MHSRDLLTAAAGHAADFLDGLPERRVGPAETDPAALRAALGGPLPDGPEDPRAVLDALVAGRRRRPDGQPVAALLRLRVRGLAARRAGRRLGRLGLGSERGPLRRRARRRGGRGGRGRLAGRAPGPAGRRRPSPSPPAARWPTPPAWPPRATTSSQRAGWDVEARRAHGRAADPPAGQRRLPRHAGARPCGCSAWAPTASSASTPTTRARCEPERAARRARRGRRPDDRVRAGGRGQQRRVRSASRPCATSPTTHGAWVHVDGAFGLWAARRARAPPPRRRRRSAPTRGPPTRTSGSTSPTTPAWPSSRIRRPTTRRSAPAPPICRRGGARRDGLDARLLAPRALVRDLGRPALARARRRGRAGRALLRVRAALRRGARRRGRRRGPQRRRAQPGPRALRRRRRRPPTPWSPPCRPRARAGWARRRGAAGARCASRCRNWATTISDVDRSCAAILAASGA